MRVHVNEARCDPPLTGVDDGRLWGHFAFGSYGSDHEERDELPAIAVGRARELWGDVVTPSEAIVVGDTPRDVDCAVANGCRSLGVATGSTTVEALYEAGADLALADLSATERVLAWMLA